jgi:two-component system alkaline phosphatase synthesis response regulator PhoP
MQTKVLIVDDEADILDLLEYNLEKEGYLVFRATDGAEALKIAQRERPDLVLLDIMMPHTDGIETCRQMRRIPQLKEIFIVFLTARAEEYSELAGFEAGADDYISKPIKPKVLMSRLRAILRRDQPAGESLTHLKVHDLEIMRDEYIVLKSGAQLVLPRKEFELLFFLAARPGKVFSREKLLEQVWGDVFVVDRTVDVHVRKLREKLGEGYIQTVKGVGYKFLSES